MLEISPVLAGTYNQPAYQPTQASLTMAANTADLAQPPAGAVAASNDQAASTDDSRRYTHFDHSASNVDASVDFTFHDFLDMINPLQHIPVASSVYRAVTDTSISPVSRIAGDALYGGIFGIASALMGAGGAMADTAIQSATGKSTVGTMIASIFGSDDNKTTVPGVAPDAPTTMLASATPTTATAVAPAASLSATQLTSATGSAALSPTTQLAALQAQAVAISNGTAPPPMLATAGGTMSPAAAIASSTTLAASGAPALAALNNPASGGSNGKAFLLDRSKLAYGGALAPTNNIQQQNMVMALSQASNTMRMGHTIYTSPLLNGPHPMPGTSTVANPAGNANTQSGSGVTTPPASTTAASSGTNHNQIPQSLIDDMIALKAVNQYQSTAKLNSTAADEAN